MARNFQVNIGLNERCGRILVSIGFFVFSLTYSEWLLIPALLFIVTGIVGWSPIYQLFGVNTNKKSGSAKEKDLHLNFPKKHSKNSKFSSRKR
ncbi:MAG TPA: DUF2892 domain-containing protein [Alphaproteobacteria bacterium]|nr:DUF2892 domain-containing protein [Alphaproteobacteria bacterium]